MRRGLIPAVLFSLVCFCGRAPGGAWTLDEGQTKIISGVTVSTASKRFDASAIRQDGFFFRKSFVQTSVEYGLTDDVTLLAAPEYAQAEWGANGEQTVHAPDAALGIGVRVLLFAHIGMLSVQGTARSGGVFDAYYVQGENVKPAASREGELRLLYGTNYRLFGDNGFIDLQAAKRWVSRPRPDETAFDATAGLWLGSATLVMVQGFNIVSGGGAQAPYTSYHEHKLEVSLVQRISERWSLQIGAFVSPAGQNIIVERGLCSAIWVDL